MESAVAAASAAFPDWAEQSVLSRQQVMFNLQHLVKNHMVWSEDFLLLVALESTRYHHHCISLIYYWKIIPTSGLALLFILTNSLNLKMSILLQLVVYGGVDRAEGGGGKSELLASRTLTFVLSVPSPSVMVLSPLCTFLLQYNFIMQYCKIISYFSWFHHLGNSTWMLTALPSPASHRFPASLSVPPPAPPPH